MKGGKRRALMLAKIKHLSKQSHFCFLPLLLSLVSKTWKSPLLVWNMLEAVTARHLP